MKLVRTLQATENTTAIALLAEQIPELTKGRLKDAMSKGAVVLSGKPQRRLRRAQTVLQAGQQLVVHYDDDILQRRCAAPELLYQHRHYSIWFKPAGMLSQGNEWGDHLSLLRQAELHFAHKQPVFLLHRLDREASGLVIIAHSKAGAAAFSKLIAEHKIDKRYVICVTGLLPDLLLQQGLIDAPLDGKPATTRFSLRYADMQQQQSWLDIHLITGRKHQIRRHFAAIQHPVVGDPQYGTGNKSAAGLALQAVRLQFDCPFTRRAVQVALPAELQLQPGAATPPDTKALAETKMIPDA